MDDKTLAIFTGIHTYKLNERSHSFGPLRDFYYNHRSLTKYWMLTRDLIAQTLHANKEFFEIPENDDGDVLDLSVEPTPEDFIEVDGAELENDLCELPHMQKLLIICTGLTLVETCLMGICEDLDEKYVLNGKGAYIQQYIRFIGKNSTIVIPKKITTELLHFAQARNNFIHQYGNKKLSHDTAQYLQKIGGIFTDNQQGLAGVHVEYFLTLLGRFGEAVQDEYWKDFSKSKSV